MLKNIFGKSIGQILPNRNVIINGDMSIWQRGESASNITSAGLVAVDRFHIINYLSSASVTVEKIDAGLADFPNAVRYRVVSVSSASDINLIANIEQRIEGINCQRLGFGQPNKKITLSFWCRSSLAGTITGLVWAKQNDRAYQFPVTINSADTWERKVVTMPADSVPLANDNLDALRVTLNIGGGTGRRNTPPYGPNVWGDFYYSDSAAYLNTMFITETAGATFDLTGVQLEAGDVATPFEHLSYQENLNRCLRYYATGIYRGTAVTYNTIVSPPYISFSQEMRGTPSMTYPLGFFSSSSDPISGLQTSVSGHHTISNKGFANYIFSSSTGYGWIGYNWVAGAEL